MKFRGGSFKDGKSPSMNHIPPTLRDQAKRASGEHMRRRGALRDQVPKRRIARSRPRSGFAGAGGSQMGHSTRPSCERADYAIMYETAILRDLYPEGNPHRSDSKRFTLPGFKRAYYAFSPHNELLRAQIPECVAHRDGHRRKSVGMPVHRNRARNYANRTENL